MGCYCYRDPEAPNTDTKKYSARRQSTAKVALPKAEESSFNQETTHSTSNNQYARRQSVFKITLQKPDEAESEEINYRSLKTVQGLSDKLANRSVTPRSARHGMEKGSRDQVEVRLRDVRILPDGAPSTFREIKVEGVLKLGEIIANNKKCWVQTHSVSIERKAKRAMYKQAASLRDLDYQHVLRVLDITQQQQLYVLYEVTEGGSVPDLVNRYQGVSEKWAAGIMRQVFAAMRYCHSKGLVVKSLCCKQVLFVETPTEEFSWVKVLVPLEVSREDLTEYTAPEVKNSSYTGPENDMYSCGVIMSHLLLGNSQPTRIQGGKASQGIRDSYLRWNAVSQDARSLMLALLSRDYRKRPSPEACLLNPWLAKFPVKSQLTPVLRTALRSLMTVRSLNSLKRVLLQVLSNLFAPYEVSRDTEKAFLELDTDMLGSVSEAKIRAQIYRLLPEEKAQTAFSSITSSVFLGEKNLSYSSFLIYASQQSLVTATNLIKAFHMLDTSHDGVVTMNQLREVLIPAGDDAASWKRLISCIASNSAAVSYSDFCSYLQQT